MKRMISILLVCALAVLMVGCGADKAAEASLTEMLEPSPEWVSALPAAAESDQILVVGVYGPTTAWISLHEKDSDGVWQTLVTTPGFIGKNGLGKTKEGDSMTPAGTFHFNAAFGIADDPGCAIPYTKVDDDSYWSGDAREGMHYNEMVSIKDYPDLDTENSEHLIEYTRQYQYCLNIDYNKEGTPGLGSAIFLHCFGPKSPYTGGCVSVPENQMKAIMQKVSPDCTVVIDTLENLGAEV